MNLTNYEELGVPANATEEQIRHAYRNVAKKLHPDVNPGMETWADAQMKRLNVILDTLTDPRKRKAYDAALAARKPYESPAPPKASPKPPPSATKSPKEDVDADHDGGGGGEAVGDWESRTRTGEVCRPHEGSPERAHDHLQTRRSAGGVGRSGRREA
jgi:DnaJ-class molecular chaperone